MFKKFLFVNIRDRVEEEMSTEALGEWLDQLEAQKVFQVEVPNDEPEEKDWYKWINANFVGDKRDYFDFADRLRNHHLIVAKYRPHTQVVNARGGVKRMMQELRWRHEVKKLLRELFINWRIPKRREHLYGGEE